MRRNWDNQKVGSTIVDLSRPPGGYASISFPRCIDGGFGHKDLQEVASGPQPLPPPETASHGANRGEEVREQ